MIKKSEDKASEYMLEKAEKECIDNAWIRFEEQQPQCSYGELGLCCRICVQGPCNVNPFGDSPKKGVCGATDYTIVARNLVRMIASGSACHSDHGRHIALTLLAMTEGRAKDYKIKDEKKLRYIAKRIGLNAEKPILELAREVSLKALEDFSRQTDEYCIWASSFLTKRRVEFLQSHSVFPTNIDRSIAEVFHRTAMGNDADPVPIIFGGIKSAIGDYNGMHIATDLTDVLFGTPKLTKATANLGVIKKDAINIAIHGHNPLLSEVVVDVAEEMQEEAKKIAKEGINVVGVCCTGNEVLMRKGVSLAANSASQELVLMTGAIEVMVVDVQCIVPSCSNLCQCYHTKLISTMPTVRIPGDTHIEFHEENAKESAREIVKIAINNFKNRNQSLIDIPDIKNTTIVGFSLEQIKELFSKFNKDSPIQYLVDNLKNGTLKGVCLFAGCNDQKVIQDYGHITIAKEMARNNVLLISTGCAAGAFAKNGLMSIEAVEKYAGDGLKKFLKEVANANNLEGLPLAWHLGSCVDNTRAMDLATEIAEHLNVDVHQIPYVATAAEDMHEKAVAIGTWCVALGLPVHVGTVPFIFGSPLITEIAEKTAKDVYGGYFIFEKNPEKASEKLLNILEYRRWKLGLDEDSGAYWTGTKYEKIGEIKLIEGEVVKSSFTYP